MMTLQENTIGPSPSERRAHVPSREAELLRDYGSNSLAFFGQALENSHFLAPDGAGLIHYRLVNQVAVVLGDPVCAPETGEQVTQSFLDVCARHHWRVAFYQASPSTWRPTMPSDCGHGRWEKKRFSLPKPLPYRARRWPMCAPAPGVLNVTPSASPGMKAYLLQK